MAAKPLRPALIASADVLAEYSPFLGHFLVGLAAESIVSALICPTKADVEMIAAPGVEIIRHPVYQFPLLWRQSRRRLLEQLTRFKPTVLHCLCENKALFTMGLARELNLPYVLNINSLIKRLGKLYIAALGCSKIMVPAETIAENLAQLHAALTEKVEQVNMGTFVERSSGCFSQAGRLVSIVTAGEFDNGADLENLLSAVKRLALDGCEFMLVITGRGRVEMNLRRILAVKGLSHIVVVVPQLRPMHRVLAAGDIFIHLRPSDTFDPVLLEAMSVGTVVAACKGGVDDLLIEGQTCVVFDRNDELSIYNTLRGLMDRPEVARRLAKSAQQYLQQNYSVSEMVSSMLRTYRDAQEQFKAKPKQQPVQAT